MNYYSHHIGDYIRDTAHLSLLEHGVYRRLLDVYYARETGIPDSQAERLVGARTDEERATVRAILTEFFTLDGDTWRQSRCDAEIAEHQAYVAEQSRKGKASAAARRLNRKGTAVEQRLNSGSTTAEQRLNNGATSVQPPTPTPNNSVRASPSDPPTVDAAIFAEARQIFGASIGGQINTAIRKKGKPWVLGVIESCRGKDPEAARAYLAAALKDPERRVVV